MKNNKTFRFKMQHFGDFFVEKFINNLEKGIRSLTLSTRGIVVTYDLRELKRAKKKMYARVGQRVTEIKRTSPEMEIFQDNDLNKLFKRIDDLESRIERRLQERESRLYPNNFSQPVAATA